MGYIISVGQTRDAQRRSACWWRPARHKLCIGTSSATHSNSGMRGVLQRWLCSHNYRMLSICDCCESLCLIVAQAITQLVTSLTLQHIWGCHKLFLVIPNHWLQMLPGSRVMWWNLKHRPMYQACIWLWSHKQYIYVRKGQVCPMTVI